MSMTKMKAPELMWLKDIGKQAANVYLDYQHPELTDEERVRILSIIEDKGVPKKQTATNYDPNRNKFVAAAWLCGGSIRQLAQLFGVTPQTMALARDKGIRDANPNIAQKGLRSATKLSYLKLSAMWEFYQALVNKQTELISGLDAVTLALVLHRMPEPSEDSEQSAYDIPTPMTKLNNEVVE